MTRLLAWTLIVLLILTPCAGAKGKAPPVEEQPITIQGNTLTLDRERNTMTYLGDVTVDYGDIVIVCDRLQALIDPNAQAVNKVLALGNVKVIKQDMVAKCGKATFYPQTRRMVFEEDPVLFKGKSSLIGNKIFVDFVSNRIRVVSNGNDRVNVELFQESTRKLAP
jgi:lipopolysaccharide export system protein LptA